SQFIGTLSPDAIVAAYRSWYPAYSPSDVFFAATTAARSWRGMLLECERRGRQGAPTYAYYLDWRSPLDGGKWGAPHTLDIPLVFANTAAGDGQTGYPPSGDGPEARQMADLMSGALLAFARTGNPQTPQLPPWPRFDPARRPAMIFDLPPRVEDDPRGNERRLFAPVFYAQPGA
ncbi:MAG TPA: carboxylesterase family protein, partial [Opitutaceae bacterium]|nr:carboxylesterase family protein [Opitutaceae bacterium]